MSERKEGWYWVKIDDTWTVQYHSKHGWPPVMSLPHAYGYEIGPRIPTPDEDWLCVPIKPTYRMTNAAAFTSHDNIETGGGGQEYRRRIAEHEYFAMLSAAPKP